MATIDLSYFLQRVPVSAPIDTIYHAWTTRAGLEKWFLREAIFFTGDDRERAATESAAKGDRYIWKWHGYDDSVSEEKTIVAANGKDLFSFRFSGNCLVTVKLESIGNMVVCNLRQEDFPSNMNDHISLYTACGTGWTFYLSNLKSVLEGGLDLRNKDVSLKNVVNS